jgi:hypothetical protein
MVTDRELLEAAAKAAGLINPRYVEATSWGTGISHGEGDDVYCVWNPLTDDGDALRLAVKVLNWPHGGRAFDNAVSAMYAVGQLPKDPYAATRRAIVRAAAEIGRGMK